jgi:D-alanyl-D-alanine carboxypeptidase (penicillin-binding protein 5/6)
VAEASNLNNALPDILPLPTIKANAPKAVANATDYILVDANSGTILAGKNENVQVPIASTTKIMTATIALENYKLDDIATISSTATSQVPSVAYLQTGEQITIENLLNCMLIPSGNDAAYAVAEHMSGDTGGTAKFVAKMNEKAKELGMTDTHYEDPAGLNSAGYSSPYDLYLITKYALQNPVFRQIVGRSSYTAKNVTGTIYHSLKQSNRLVTDFYPGAIGVKTGFTDEAGHCLVGAATRNGHTLISIVLKTYSTTPSASADEAERLLTWGFANTSWQ